MKVARKNSQLTREVLTDRVGPYAPAVLRYQISFPPRYPTLPPAITFVNDIFHPLVTPLTTYTYTTGSVGSDPVSATGEERLPPGGFSLTHRFPNWFGRASRNATESSTPRTVSGQKRSASAGSSRPEAGNITSAPSPVPSPVLRSTRGPVELNASGEFPSIREVLLYLKKSFDDESSLDDLPLEAAGNPGAWHAWRAHRHTLKEGSNSCSGKLEAFKATAQEHMPTASSIDGTTQQYPKGPNEWNWEGVWEERVRKGIDASVSDPVLFRGAGGGGGDDFVSHLEPNPCLNLLLIISKIQFIDADEDLMQTVKLEMMGKVSKP